MVWRRLAGRMEHFHTCITVKEIFIIVLALELWADQLKNKCIIFHCNNSAVVQIINRQSSKNNFGDFSKTTYFTNCEV